MRIRLFTIILLSACLATTHAQDKRGRARNIVVSYSPMTNDIIKLTGFTKSDPDIMARYQLENGYAGSLSFEKQCNGRITETELTYRVGKFKSSEISEEIEHLVPYTLEDIYSASISWYYGYTLLGKRSRIQLPIYLGIGGSYTNGDIIHNITFDVAAKARLKLFITPNVGLFAGANWRGGLGTKKIKQNDDPDDDLLPSLSIANWNLNGGLIVCW